MLQALPPQSAPVVRTSVGRRDDVSMGPDQGVQPSQTPCDDLTGFQRQMCYVVWAD